MPQAPIAFVTVSPPTTPSPRIVRAPARASPVTQTTMRAPARASPVTQTTMRAPARASPVTQTTMQAPARASPTTAVAPGWSRQVRPAASLLGSRPASIVRCPPVFPTVQLDKPPLRPQLGSIDFSPEELPCPCAMITLPWVHGCPICRLVTPVGLEAHPIAVIISRTIIEETLTNPNVYILRYLAIATDPATPVVDEWKAALSYFAAYNIVGYGFTEKPVQLLEHRPSGVSVVYMRLDMGELPFPFHLIQAEFRSVKLRDFSQSEGSQAPAHVVALVDFRFGNTQNWNASCMRQVLYLICQLHVIVQSCLVYCRGTTFQVVVVPPNTFAQTVDEARRMHPAIPPTEMSSTTGSRVGTPNRGSRRVCRPQVDSGSVVSVARAPAFPVARPGSWNTGVNFTPEPEWHDEPRIPLTRSDLKEFEMLVEDILPSPKSKFAPHAGRQMAVQQSAPRRGLIRHVPCCCNGTATASRDTCASRVCVANNPDQRLLDKVDRLEHLLGTLVDKLTAEHEQKRNAELARRSEMLEEKVKALMSLQGNQLGPKSAQSAIEDTSETRDDRPAEEEFVTAESPTSHLAVTAISDSGALSDLRRCTALQDCENPFRNLEAYCLHATLTDPKL
ncbi:MAG: hypothetical protein KVP17_005021 [Porospora cf. gigantea B]|uniref:uncharacterized protein n=1 Tax=Porospora cf. gigantea B TaxID=2853592 RepID=UPI0035719207|nr:MAG: hypothetical protein KVP17_005021 [Porospora cf. gigantea B]